MSTQAQKNARRRRVLPGFPIERPFQSVEEVRDYLAGDQIVCLLCGRRMRRLAMHLPAIHKMSEDEYRKRYNIPWSYGLGCSEYTELIGAISANRVEEKGMPAVDVKRAKRTPRESPFKADIARSNLGAHLGSVKYQTDGMKEQRKAAARAKRGSLEHREKIAATSKARSEELAAACHERFAGVPKSPEHRDAISAALRRHYASRK